MENLIKFTVLLFTVIRLKIVLTSFWIAQGYTQLHSSAMHHSHFMKRWQNHGITSVVEEGLGTDVCLCEGLRWRSKYVSWSDGKVNMVCDGWGALMWSLTADIMVKQAIHQWILDQRIPPLPSVLHAVEQTCSVLSICSLKTVIRQMLFMKMYLMKIQ